ncbi:MAG: chemotaxis protein CheA [Gammaproteobacteria bacterium]|nr:MAG: chemotaxis protein CheA [Gammaproteobacteria bacterium]
MSSDFDQFHAIFFEESLEGLDDMESGLLGLQPGETDKEVINGIFRVAHSVKGGSGMFGFTEITNLTHIMETLLDEMRGGQREINKPGIDLLLLSVDCLRDMLETQKNGEEHNQQQIGEVQKKLEAMLSGDAQEAVVEAQDANEEPNLNELPENNGWGVKFYPHEDMLRTGNDPVLMFKVLEMSGELETRVDLSKLPKFNDLDPEQCLLGWDITVKGNVHRDEITEVFDWVEGDCDLEVTRLVSQLSTADDDPALPAKQPASPTDELSPEAAITQSPEEHATNDQQSPIRTESTPPEERREQKSERRTPSTQESSSIRVNIDKVDALVNMVGELVITQSMLARFNEESTEADLEMLRDGLEQLERNTRELQESVMQIRMLPISFSFNRFPRLVRDICGNLGKKAELVLAGEQTEVDKTVLEKIGDPLVHLVRNSLDHGLEIPEVRLAAGKPETGTLRLNAFHQGGNIVIEITDDGAGLNREKILAKAREKGLIGEREELSDEQIYNLIFQPGFSTADTLSDLSGRGVGMDVVRRNIRDLGGNVSIQSQAGEGSTVTIRLPLTMAILDGQLIKVGDQTYVVSLVSIVESLQVEPEYLNSVSGNSELYKLRDEYIPIIRLYDLLGIDSEITDLTQGLLVVVEDDNRKFGLFVDDLLGQQQVVIKSLATNFQQIEGVSGATILGDGKVALILDVAGLVQIHSDQNSAHIQAASAAA